MPNSIKVKSENCFFNTSEVQNNSFGELCFSSLERVLKVSSALLKKSSILEHKKSVFFIKIIVFDAIYFKKLCRFSSENLFSTFGIMLILFTCSVESCVSTSKVLNYQFRRQKTQYDKVHCAKTKTHLQYHHEPKILQVRLQNQRA